MEALFNSIYTDPLHYIGYFFAFLGALGGFLFLIGFGGGVSQFFTFEYSDSHMRHVRARVTWGLLVCMVVLGLWEIVRVITGEISASYLWLSLLLLTPLWIPWIKSLLKSGGGGGH